MIALLGLIVRVLRRWCQRLVQVSQVAPGTLTVREVTTDGLTALSLGDVFEFRASLALSWRSTGLTETTLQDAIECHRDLARSAVCELFSRLAHRYDPQSAFELERELNAELGKQDFTYEVHRTTVSCSARARVALDRDVREALRGPLLARMGMEFKHDNGMRRADLVDELTRHWSKVIDRLSGDPLVTPAAKLTEQEFAGVIGDLAVGGTGHGPSEIAQLIEILEKVYKGPPSGGDYEWSESIGLSIRALSKRLGEDSSSAQSAA